MEDVARAAILTTRWKSSHSKSRQGKGSRFINRMLRNLCCTDPVDPDPVQVPHLLSDAVLGSGNAVL